MVDRGSLPSLNAVQPAGSFTARHIGPRPADTAEMLATVGFDSLEALVDAAVPETVRDRGALQLPAAEDEATVLALLRSRGDKTICPSDVARVVGGDSWRSRMEVVRHVVERMVAGGVVQVTQKGAVVDVATAKGPIRIGWGTGPVSTGSTIDRATDTR